MYYLHNFYVDMRLLKYKVYFKNKIKTFFKNGNPQNKKLIKKIDFENIESGIKVTGPDNKPSSIIVFSFIF